MEDNDTEISQKEAKKKGVRIALGMAAGLAIALLGSWYFYAADHGTRSGKTHVRIEKNATGAISHPFWKSRASLRVLCVSASMPAFWGKEISCKAGTMCSKRG